MDKLNKKTYALSRQYTDESIQGVDGAIAGKNAQVASIEAIEKDGITGHRVTFAWYADGESTPRVETIDVMDGESSEVAVERNESNDGVVITAKSGDGTETKETVYDGKQGERGADGNKGDKGDDGFSPEITIAESSADTYRLHIKDGSGEYDTPNLKGGDGWGIDVYTTGERLVFRY